MKKILGLGVVILIVVFIVTPSVLVAKEKVYEFKAQSTVPLVSRTTTVGLFKYLDRVEEMSKGRIHFQRFGGGALAKAKEALDALEIGMYDVLLSYPPYYIGHVPEGGIFITPFMFRSLQSVYDIWYNTDVGKLISDAYREKGSVVVGPVFLASNVLCSREPFESLEYFKGKKVRAPGGTATKTVEALGASPVHLVGSEIYTALQRGTIDGYIYPLYTNIDEKFHEQAKMIMQPSLGYVITIVQVAEKTWNKLPEELRTVFLDAGKAHGRFMLEWAEKQDEKVFNKLATLGMKKVYMPEKEVDVFVKKLQTDVWGSYVKNDRCKKILDICKKHEGWE